MKFDPNILAVKTCNSFVLIKKLHHKSFTFELLHFVKYKDEILTSSPPN